jgi:hypothetical protein
LHTHIEFTSEGFSIAAKGWQAHMKEERHNKSPQIGWDFIEIIFPGNKMDNIQFREIEF